MPSIYRLFIFFLIVMAGRSDVHAQSSDTAAKGAIFFFQETVHDFGRVPPDTIVHCRFEFINRGNTKLIINDIALSCPCFTVDWTKGPVMPGEKGWVSIDYPTTDKIGPFDKALWIASNAINNTSNLDRYELRVMGNVQKAHTVRQKKCSIRKHRR